MHPSVHIYVDSVFCILYFVSGHASKKEAELGVRARNLLQMRANGNGSLVIFNWCIFLDIGIALDVRNSTDTKFSKFSATAIHTRTYQIPSDLWSQASNGSVSTMVGDHMGILSAVVLFLLNSIVKSWTMRVSAFLSPTRTNDQTFYTFHASQTLTYIHLSVFLLM